jgi:hypothetical protein
MSSRAGEPFTAGFEPERMPGEFRLFRGSRLVLADRWTAPTPGKDEVIWLRACLEACAASVQPIEGHRLD